jgi:hypothetical protein
VENAPAARMPYAGSAPHASSKSGTIGTWTNMGGLVQEAEAICCLDESIIRLGFQTERMFSCI